MKKFLFACSLLVILAPISACEQSPPPTSLQDQEITLEFSFGERTGIYSGDINSDGLPDGYGTFASENSSGDTWTYEGDWINGHWEGTGASTWEDGAQYQGEFSNDVQSGQGSYTLTSGDKYVGTFVDGEPLGEGTLYYSDGSHLSGEFNGLFNAQGTYYSSDGYSYAAILETNELSLTPLQDFFSSTDRQNYYTELFKSYQYTNLVQYVNDYIDQNDVTPLDTAYKILDLITPLQGYESSWIISHDDFDDTYSVTFSGASEISNSCSLSASVKSTASDLKLGFIRNDWLFFDHIEISVDGVKCYSIYVGNDTVKDVLSGSAIREYAFCSIPEDIVKQIHDGQNVIMRFINDETHEYLDHTMTTAEKDALYCAFYLQINNRDLDNLLYRYNNSNK